MKLVYIYIYIYIYILEGHSKTPEPLPERRVIVEHFCSSNTLQLFIKLVELNHISVLISVQTRNIKVRKVCDKL